MAEKNIDNVYAFLEAVCGQQNLTLSADKEHVASVAEGLMEMFNSYGYFCCPCREAWGDRKKDRDIICPCEYCKTDVKEYGQCYCGLFVDGSDPERELSSIPDRRDDELYP